MSSCRRSCWRRQLLKNQTIFYGVDEFNSVGEVPRFCRFALLCFRSELFLNAATGTEILFALPSLGTVYLAARNGNVPPIPYQQQIRISWAI